jgi:hypothetical protein
MALSVVEELVEGPTLNIPSRKIQDERAALLHDLLSHRRLNHGVIEASHIQLLVYAIADIELGLEILKGLSRSKIFLNL